MYTSKYRDSYINSKLASNQRKRFNAEALLTLKAAYGLKIKF